MRILLIHNRYHHRGGEDTAFEAETRLLRAGGHEVRCYTRHNDEIFDRRWLGHTLTAIESIWSQHSRRELDQLLAEFKPHIAHFHNTFPLISPSAYYACRTYGVPVVQTLHNFRLICAAGTLFRSGKVCEECVDHGLHRGVLHRCYRKSLPGSLAVTAMQATHRKIGTYEAAVDRYIALTQFAKARFVAGGLSSDKIVVKPNFLFDAPASGDGSGGFFSFVGRLSPEKGVMELLEAWKSCNEYPLRVVGGGPLLADLRAFAAQNQLNVQFVGARPREEVYSILQRSRALIVPSQWYEGFGLVVIESFACGTPVLCSRLGSLDELVDEERTGLKFQQDDPRSIASVVHEFAKSDSVHRSFRHAARAEFDEKYSPARNLRLTEEIYRGLVR